MSTKDLQSGLLSGSFRITAAAATYCHPGTRILTADQFVQLPTTLKLKTAHLGPSIVTAVEQVCNVDVVVLMSGDVFGTELIKSQMGYRAVAYLKRMMLPQVDGFIPFDEP